MKKESNLKIKVSNPIVDIKKVSEEWRRDIARMAAKDSSVDIGSYCVLMGHAITDILKYLEQHEE